MAHEQPLSASVLVESASCHEKQAEWMFFWHSFGAATATDVAKSRKPSDVVSE